VAAGEPYALDFRGFFPRWLAKAAGYLGYILKDGHPLPHLFTPVRLEEVDQAIVAPDDASYLLDKILPHLACLCPDVTLETKPR
jgi:hypothetical protein